MTETEQSPETAAPAESALFPALAAWQRAWVDGTSWSEDEESDAEARPWPDFRTYIPAA
ncbi:hypothetical protein [Streptomyces sp. NPDC006638]|uniref:hypothetical protein n=1 Tax=unclassified Streptomyces TaxID=2593676 RepID=UPI0033B83953